MEYMSKPFGYIDLDTADGDQEEYTQQKPKKKSPVFDQTGSRWTQRKTIMKRQAEREAMIKLATHKAMMKRSHHVKELLLILLKQGMSTAEIVRHTGYSRNGIQKARTRYRSRGIID